ncbi:MAG TPA: RagB/SusD family nutrient uptake outer membrane protein [Niabella sp.]|nr:RagB/SusD family nutrient uptake outer membrane protein [Niabella sp.]
MIKGMFAVLVIITANSCKKGFLDEVNYSSQSSDQYFATKSGFESLIIGSYSNLRTIYNSKAYQNISQLGTDLVTQNYPGAVNPLNQYTVTLTSNEGDIYTHWNNLYTALKNVNSAIDRAPNVITNDKDPDGIDPAVRDKRVAEAKALRALYLFEIVRNWGKGPLMVSEPDAPTTTAELSDGAAFYTQIFKDLGDAIAVLPAKTTGADFGRMSASAAKHLRALAYLTRGYQTYADASDFTNAYNDAVDVINNSGYALLSDFLQVHRQANQTNNEILFSIGFSTTANNNVNNWPKWYLFPYREGWAGLSKSAIYSNDDVFGIPTKLAYLIYDWQKDRRAEVTFMSPVNAGTATSIDGTNRGKNWFECTTPVAGKFALGDTVIYFPVPTDGKFKQWTQADKDAAKYTVYNFPAGDVTDWANDEYYKNAYQTTNSTTRAWLPVWKFKDANTVYNENGNASGTRDIYLFRLAETYLIAAEAAVKKNDNSNALFYLNKIRARAEKTAGALQKTGTVTVDDILDERALELFGEVPRWNDLVRTKKLGERVLKYNWDVTHITGGVQTQLTAAADSKFYLRPLPLAWLNSLSNQEQVPQNPGW